MLPEDFDWRFYLSIHPDLGLAGIKTEEAASNHYKKYGFFEGRSYKDDIPKDFNWKEFLIFNPDLICGLQNITKESVESHYLSMKHNYGTVYVTELEKCSNILVDKSIFIFYHLYCQNDWKDIFVEHINLIKSTGLLSNVNKFYINIIGNKDDLDFVNSHTEDGFFYTNLISNEFEFLTLDLMVDISKTTEFYGLYLHSKSSSYSKSHPYKRKIKFWREILNYQLIKNWEICYQQLSKFDVVGTLYKNGNTETELYWKEKSRSVVIQSPQYFTPHFSGNFFWFDSKYLSTVSKLEKNQRNNRYNAEWFLFKNHPTHLNIFNDKQLWIQRLEEEFINQ